MRSIAKFKIYGELVMDIPDNVAGDGRQIADYLRTKLQHMADSDIIEALDLGDRSIWAIDDAGSGRTLYEE